MKLLNLEIKNFKGITDFTLSPNGHDISIHGDNATGKTTLFDSVLWLLAGKDSQGKADFQIKPVDSKGKERHNLESSVEASFSINGTHSDLTLKKVFKEKWTKKRGTATKEMTGHTTDYYIDGVPEKKKAFDEKIKSIIDESVFRLLTNPFEFNRLHWQERRSILISICGDVSDLDVIDSDESLSGLTEILKGNTMEDHKKKITAQKQEINRELTEIPARIDELSKSIQDCEKPDSSALVALGNKNESLQEDRRNLLSPMAVSEKKQRIVEIHTEILKMKNAAGEDVSARQKPVFDKINSLSTTRRGLELKLSSLEDRIKKEEDRNRITREAMDSMRENWKRENEKTFCIDTVCPTCGQDLLEEKLQTAQENFNNIKAETLKEINDKGREMKETVACREKDITDARVSLDKLASDITIIDTDLATLENELNGIVAGEVDTSVLDQEKEKLQNEIKDLESGSQDEIIAINSEITEIKAKIDQHKQQEATFNAAESSRKRIIELEDREKFLAGEFERLESELHLIEKFIVAKVDMLEENINSKFKMACFKLFEVQINGGINEMCETLYNGVPFNHGLNNAACINVGLDIINTLAEHYDFFPPIFIDNRESVTELIMTGSQQISLIVDADYSELSVVEGVRDESSTNKAA